ncbi:hypothetical protein CRE_25232 [Caenorhabditis remanei]|uniref:Uncharacterized protein n=1 Tax=Caenorhabditis remanei TaxID=31234 RepID=E3LS24_CAERE|nr:hypothetical protein CRE_25232 [Caenorhabditis remanei]
MLHFIAIEVLYLFHFIAFSLILLVGCEKKKPSKVTQNSSAKKNPVPPKTDQPPSSHMYVDVTCQPKSVMVTKQMPVNNSKVKSKSVNSNEKPMKESPTKNQSKNMTKELEKLRDEAVKEGDKKEEEDFGYENCADMTEEQLKKAKAVQAMSKVQKASKGQTTRHPLPPAHGKVPIVHKTAIKK